MVARVYMRGGHVLEVDMSTAKVCSMITDALKQDRRFISGFTSYRTRKNMMLNVRDVVAVEPRQ